MVLLGSNMSEASSRTVTNGHAGMLLQLTLDLLQIADAVSITRIFFLFSKCNICG